MKRQALILVDSRLCVSWNGEVGWEVGFCGNRLQHFGKKKFWWEIFSRTESYFSEKWIVSDENAKFQVFCTETHLG